MYFKKLNKQSHRKYTVDLSISSTLRSSNSVNRVKLASQTQIRIKYNVTKYTRTVRDNESEYQTRKSTTCLPS